MCICKSNTYRYVSIGVFVDVDACICLSAYVVIQLSVLHIDVCDVCISGRYVYVRVSYLM